MEAVSWACYCVVSKEELGHIFIGEAIIQAIRIYFLFFIFFQDDNLYSTALLGLGSTETIHDTNIYISWDSNMSFNSQETLARS